jgi:hypothetical protein
MKSSLSHVECQTLTTRDPEIRFSFGVEFEIAIMDELFGSLCLLDDPRIGSFQSLLGRRKRQSSLPDQSQHCFGPHD